MWLKLLSFISLKKKIMIGGGLLLFLFGLFALGSITVTAVLWLSFVILIVFSFKYEWLMIKRVAGDPDKLKNKWTWFLFIPGIIGLFMIDWFIWLLLM